MEGATGAPDSAADIDVPAVMVAGGAGMVAAAAEAAAAASGAAAAEDEPAAKPLPRNKKDPLEGWNRKVFSFNDAIDTAVLKPVAQAYKDVVPEYVRNLVDNVFGNVADAWSTVNHILQGKFESSLQMGMRVATNSVLGFGGLLDIGTEIGLEKQPEDFGQTLGRWGVPSGPYVVLPVLGPSTLRDTAALPVDMQASATSLIDDTRAKVLSATLLQVVSTRAGLLGASRVLDDVALDKYSFLRDAYLARRQNQVYDGNPPPSPDDEE
ncbi:VacJ family lipoprotein [Ideonella sp. DXS29W]|uniref:VacJ family lipoprotein n=1 Tax=Ideonella lacteola TaxID=2984193 RepID=A0ABU9BT55_9BURK